MVIGFIGPGGFIGANGEFITPRGFISTNSGFINTNNRTNKHLANPSLSSENRSAAVKKPGFAAANDDGLLRGSSDFGNLNDNGNPVDDHVDEYGDAPEGSEDDGSHPARGRQGRAGKDPLAEDRTNTNKDRAIARAVREIEDAELLKEVVVYINVFFTGEVAVRSHVEAAYDAYWTNEPYMAKLPEHAAVLAIRYCNGRGGLSEVVGGKLASIGRGDLLYVARDAPPVGTRQSGPGNAAIEARFAAQDLAMQALIQNVVDAAKRFDDAMDLIAMVDNRVPNLTNVVADAAKAAKLEANNSKKARTGDPGALQHAHREMCNRIKAAKAVAQAAAPPVPSPLFQRVPVMPAIQRAPAPPAAIPTGRPVHGVKR
ncbi:hypothetical protein QBC33DRAFT_563323 [Phialemonium atrogriseum]|uniref:Uncharacterized protein n=1 Tax=Phialemonium atrogriseum TaxID=1093897 RepID=A0AAJ0FD75_9PEZI|nr:uncharacterized protein QBC33DRAFT_563323 [Phialemonium atrogriseum]KAK1762912.1 hypothetical protein QBC33DRAFT_563323 [Phialemonium atrogriseum]